MPVDERSEGKPDYLPMFDDSGKTETNKSNASGRVKSSTRTSRRVILLGYCAFLLSCFAVTAITTPMYVTGDTEGEFPYPPTGMSILVVITLAVGLFSLWRWWRWTRSTAMAAAVLLLFVLFPLWQLLSLCAEYDCL